MAQLIPSHQILMISAGAAVFLIILFAFKPNAEYYSDDELRWQIRMPEERARSYGIQRAWQLTLQQARELNLRRNDFTVAFKLEEEFKDGFSSRYEDWLADPTYNQYVGIVHRGRKLIWVELWIGYPPRTFEKEAWLPWGLIVDPERREIVGLQEFEFFSKTHRFIWNPDNA